MNHKLKIGLEIGGGLVAIYILYKLYSNYQANQQAAANAAADSIQFLPPLQTGGYAPTQTSPGNVDTGGSDLDNLINSILNPQTTSDSSTQQPITSAPQPVTSTPQPSNKLNGSSPVASLPSGMGGSNRFRGSLSGVGTRIIIPTSNVNIASTDGVTSSIV